MTFLILFSINQVVFFLALMEVLILLLVVLLTVQSHEVSYTALRFGKDTESYILMQPSDVNELTDSLTVCSWVKRLSQHSSYQYWLTYVDTSNRMEIGITDTASCYLLQDWITYTRPARSSGEWHHICLSWSISSRSKRSYYDGVQIGLETTPSGRKLGVPGSLMFGQCHYSYGGEGIQRRYYFGGELFETNVFKIQLTASQIQEMYSLGRCANKSETLKQSTYLSWEDILQVERNGNVTEVEMEECTHTHPTEETAEDETGPWQFLRRKMFYNRVISEQLLNDMTWRLKLLGEFYNHTADDALIGHLEKHHTDVGSGNETEEHSAEEKDESLEPLSPDSWMFLTIKIFYNKVITEQLLSEMTDRLELVGEFIGHVCDDALILHLEKHH